MIDDPDAVGDRLEQHLGGLQPLDLDLDIQFRAVGLAAQRQDYVLTGLATE